jgi:hypothetical protein
MNNNFQNLLDRFSDEWEEVVNSTTLQEIEKTFSKLESTREEILNWVFDNILNDEELADYFNMFGELESNLVAMFGDIPVFDEEFDIYDSFDEYEAYYQRYGCMVPEFVISWDKDSILFHDDDGNVQITQRPDILMGAVE